MLPSSSASFSRTTSCDTEQSVDSMYNEAIKFKKAGMLAEAEVIIAQ